MSQQPQEDVAGRRFDVADAAPLVLDGNAAVVSWTEDARRLLGYPAAEVLGRPATGLLFPADAERAVELAERCR